MSDKDLRFVISHELAHVRRRDLACLWVMTLARTLHWFNPLVWIAARCARLDAELACDATVLRANAPAMATRYGAALLRIAESISCRQAPVPLAGIVESRRALRERLRRISDFRPNARGQTGIVAVLVGTVPLPSLPVCFCSTTASTV